MNFFGYSISLNTAVIPVNEINSRSPHGTYTARRSRVCLAVCSS